VTIATQISRADVFAANRAHGCIELTVTAEAGVTRVARLHEVGSARVRFPAHAGSAEAVLLNTAGGIAGGDRFTTDIRVGEGAHLVVTTAAAEKIYRAIGASSDIELRLNVEAGGSLSWLPQETILFDRARLDRRIAIELAEGAKLILAEALVLGRSAMGETVAAGVLIDRWRLRRGGRLVYADGVRLDGDIAAALASRASAGGAVALATVVVAPGNDEFVAAVRSRQDDFRGEVGVSAWHGIAVVRLVARDGAALRHDLVCALGAAGATLPRLWLN
jgi:urease accessory protein